LEADPKDMNTRAMALAGLPRNQPTGSDSSVALTRNPATRCPTKDIDLLSRSRRAQAIWNGDIVFRNDNSLRRRLHRIDFLRQFVARAARVRA